ncbi:13678_t:CDS:2 [Dentiscutata erythropus]|uniref:13678_t:CDS:1 n=1 Tax=Dentiscutata erythropus TaxID=1348616 RepID=A0A9N8ZPP4_9GLOM|nr:13678_t:CDS:2 [Dentiscutata erythropus]
MSITQEFTTSLQTIPRIEKAQTTYLNISGRCQSGHGVYSDGCYYCKNKNFNNTYTQPQYRFYNTILEGLLNLDDFVNLEQLHIQGNGQDQEQRQKLTSLKIDKCNKLTSLTITYTTLTKLNIRENITLKTVDLSYNQLGYLSLNSKMKCESLNLAYNQQIIFDDDRLKSQVERLINSIRNVESTDLGDLKLEVRKIEKENLEFQLVIAKNIKNGLSKDKQSFVEILQEAQQEVLQNDNAFTRKLLENAKKNLSDVLTAEEIQDFLGNIVESNEMEIQLNDLKIREHQEQA